MAFFPFFKFGHFFLEPVEGYGCLPYFFFERFLSTLVAVGTAVVRVFARAVAGCGFGGVVVGGLFHSSVSLLVVVVFMCFLTP